MAKSLPLAFDKVQAALLYLAAGDAVTDLDKYKAGKLIFLADKYHLVRYGRTIFGDFYRALELGPVPQRIVDLLHQLSGKEPLRGAFAERLAEVLEVDRRFQYPRFRARVPFDRDALSQSEVAALAHIVEVHGRKTFAELKALTHGMPAYQRAWGKRGKRGAVPMDFAEFFEEDPDARAGAREEWIETEKVRRAFAVVE